MNEDYLWDRTGQPDPKTERLERLLGSLGHSGRAAPRFKPRVTHWWLAAAAAVLIGAALSGPLFLRGPFTGWHSSDGAHLRSGQVIETGLLNRATIHSDQTGEVTIDPGSRLRLVAANDREQRFDLQAGTIHALIWAPAGRFVVDTPSSKTIDLGCRYTLQVMKNGSGLLTVELGWVAFEKDKVESFIPAGAACVTRPKLGPGIPYFTDASKVFRDALSVFDSSGDPLSVSTAITEARPRDALSLWHLMIRTHGEERGKLFDRFALLARTPRGLTRDAVISGNPKALDAAWDALDLGETGEWRRWKKLW